MEREHSLPKRLAQQPGLRWDALFNDLSLFASLCLARLIVLRTLRRQKQERIERLKYLRLAPARDEACE
jgi:hypothetical protein